MYLRGTAHRGSGSEESRGLFAREGAVAVLLVVEPFPIVGAGVHVGVAPPPIELSHHEITCAYMDKVPSLPAHI